MTLRWTDLRDGRLWTVWITLGTNPLVAFASEDDLHTVRVDFTDDLEARSNEELRRLLDRARELADEVGGRVS